ncbi:MAG: peptidylprolyl isomerase [Kiritimatiellia bacterium]|nr:peptidylprolyl isomerase [Kiritimatiellia bacterium]MDP6809516.1 peptidylprolyl isomerase [Kiritimatiellia bacterium]MDP7022668.1 peptidylprolyl isomerase [Kiritimatiellia bacterium]
MLETSKGSIEVTLWQDKAPATVSNFLAYVDNDYYSNLIFHRVIDGFMIQGGGFDASMRQKETEAPIKNEASKDAPNARGTIAMARTANINSATSQFFINLKANNFLNHRDTTKRGFGYCAFGKVTDGMDVVDAIAKVATGRHGGHADVPTEPVVIKAIRRKE